MQYKSLNDLALELCQSTSLTTLTDSGDDSGDMVPSDRSVLEHLFEKNIEHKQDLLVLFKKRREVLQRRLAMKKSELEEINYKSDEIVAISKSLSKDLAGLSQLNRALVDFQNILAKRKLNFVNELEIEFNIQKEIMLSTLSLASDINVNASLLKKRRDLYEKEKKKFNKLNVKLQHERAAMELEQLNEDRNSMNMDQFRAELSNIAGKSLIVGGSPVSLHRKNSYRLAQEQKLFLESNCALVNKPNRNQIARRVKQLNNNMIIINSTTLNSSNSNASSSSANSSNIQQLVVNCDLDAANVTTRHHNLLLGGNKPNNFIPTDLLNTLPPPPTSSDHSAYNQRADASSSGYASADLKYRSTSSNEMNNFEGSSDTTTNSQESTSSKLTSNNNNNNNPTKYARIIANGEHQMTSNTSSSSLTNPSTSQTATNDPNDYKRYSKDKNLFSNLDHSSTVIFMPVSYTHLAIIS